MAFASSSGDDESRSAQWKEKRHQKFQKIKPYHRNTIEKALLALEKRGFSDVITVHYKFFYPKFGSLSTGSGLAPGVRFWHPNIRSTRLDIQASAAWSLKNYQQFDFQFGKYHERATEYFLTANAAGGGPQVDIIPTDSRSF